MQRGKNREEKTQIFFQGKYSWPDILGRLKELNHLAAILQHYAGQGTNKKEYQKGGF
jgi:hypothetical protein